MGKASDKAYAEWLIQGPSAPTNGDIVRRDNIDEELLLHLSDFIWQAALKRAAEICLEQGQDLMRQLPDSIDFQRASDGCDICAQAIDREAEGGGNVL